MLELSRMIASLLDYPFGWLLALPRDLTIVLIALGTSLLMTFVRKWTTDQGLMRRCRDDLSRLAELRREAKKSNDREAVKRMQATEGMIKWTQTKAEFMGLAISILPVALLATWAYERLDYLPPKVNQEVTFKATYPLSSVDRATHIVTPDGAHTEGPVIQIVHEDTDKTNGVAEWKVKFDSPGEHEVVIRHRGQTVRHLLRVGERIYNDPVESHDGAIVSTEAVLEQPRFLGFVPGIPPIGFAPWLVGYLILSVIMVPGLRRVLGVC